MATDALRTDVQSVSSRLPRETSMSAWQELERLLRPLASLKLTVVLFAMAIFLIFAGTLAQVSADVWVILRTYFRTWVAWVPFQVFFPKSFFPSVGQIPGGFYFPGGFTIGVLMAVNLLAAHGIRFKIQATGARLWAGLAVIAAGVALTWLVIVTQQETDSLTAFAGSNWSSVWFLLKVILAGIWAACAYRLFTVHDAPKWQRWALSIVGVIAGAAFCWLMYLYLAGKEWPLGDSAMRILWQLIKATSAALVLLAGCLLVFRKRAGIVLLHSGILLMMANELVVYGTHVETLMSLKEGETSNWVQDTRSSELAVIDKSDPNEDRVIVVPQSLLKVGEVVSDDRLPFDVRVDEFFINSTIDELKDKDKNRANAGNGLDIIAVWRRPGTGTDTESDVDYPAAYVTLFEKGTKKELGTYLVGAMLNELLDAGVAPERVKVGDKKYEISLRFERHFKPYSVHLVDARQDNYPGTHTPKNYSSDVRIIDEDRNVNRKVKIWMNNPHRYGGDTFYQTGMQGEYSTLSVVSNTGWMIPYLACMIVAVGMLAQFLITLGRFIQRRSQVPLATVVAEPRAVRKAKERAAETSSQARWLPRLFPLLVVLVLGGWALSKARIPSAKDGEMDLYAAGKLPVMYQGRAKPLDTLARQSMVVMSNRQGFERPAEPGELNWLARLRGKETKSEPAIKWLLDVISGAEAAENHRVIRIDSDDVLAPLDLQRRKGFMYSIGEIRKNYDEFKAEVDRAEKIPNEELSTYEKKLIEVNRRIGTYTLAVAAFRPFPMPTIPSEKEFEADPDGTQRVLEQIRAIGQGLPRLHAELMRMEPPLAVPMPGSPLGWIAYSEAKDREFFQRLVPSFEPNEAVGHWDKILAAYERGDATGFNRAVDRYQAYLDQHGPSDLEAFVPGWEAFFNNFEPFYYAAFLYLFAFVLSALAWLGWTGPLNRAAFWLLVFTFVFHTAALILRMYISGRPPVTNLYSSAVFIGWGCVLFGLVFELIYRMGIGNTIAAVAGVATLAIAHLLMTHVPADRGDTMAVLRAVLDTQFWLATHVVCMTMGYATTFVAGLFGLIYIIRGVFTRSLTPELGKELTRMTYGTLCFAIFFSFVGTVLGGLWADDSWGRFWGWDPKENGALIIVLWNALVLHARWGGMVKDRGLALLSIGGNIVVGWSYFGVNELGIGKHSYGFTEGVLLYLGLFVASQLIVIAIGMLPRRQWLSGTAAA